MKTVLITRPKEQAVYLISHLERRGLRSVLFPTIEIVPLTTWEIPPLNRYDGVFFTSTNGVRHFLEPLLLRRPNALAVLRNLQLFAVGKKTSALLSDYNLTATSLPERADAASLVRQLEEPLGNKRFLFVRGSLAERTIPEYIKSHGGICDECEVYDTRKTSPENATQVKTLLAQGMIDCIAFTSPSTARNFFELMTGVSLQSRIRIAAIGETTATALYEFGFTAHILPPEQTGESLAEAIATYFAVQAAK